MNARKIAFLGLECTNDGNDFLIRLHKPNFARIGHGIREFLLVSCTLVTMSLFTIGLIVWVATTVADANNPSIQPNLKAISVPLPDASPLERRFPADSPRYSLEDNQHQWTPEEMYAGF